MTKGSPGTTNTTTRRTEGSFRVSDTRRDPSEGPKKFVTWNHVEDGSSLLSEKFLNKYIRR